MPKHLSLATVIDKNRIASPNPFFMLLEIDVTSSDTGILIETIRLARNNEDVIHDGQTYTAAIFDFEIEESADEIPEVSIVVKDPTRTVISRTEAYDGGVGWRVRMKYVSAVDLDRPAEIEELVYILAARAKSYELTLTLGARNPLAQRFPRRLQWRDRCSWAYKGPECGYNGPRPTCDFSLQGPNGCAVHNNTLRFGGFPGIRSR